MLKVPDRADFEKVQIPEIRGLEKLNVLQYHKIANLPNTAQLLNSISMMTESLYRFDFMN